MRVLRVCGWVLAIVGAIDLARAAVQEARAFPGRVRFALSEAQEGRDPFAFDLL